MKNSSKFVLIVLAVIAILMIVLTIMVRSIINDHIVVNKTGEGGSEYSFSGGSDSGAMIEKEYDFADFNKLRIAGGWDADISYADDYSVVIKARERTINDLRLDKEGTTLNIRHNLMNGKHDGDFHGASVEIRMPELAAVRIEGAINLKASDFTGELLDIRLDGAGQIVGRDCEFEQLELVSNGAVNVDFKESSLTNADVRIEGAGNIMLNMNGGELTGFLAGLSNLEYSGDVSRLDVEKDGIGGVSKR